MTQPQWRIDEDAARALSCDRRRDPLHLFSQGPDDRDRLLSDAAAGADRATRTRLANMLGARRTGVTRISADLMAHQGIDPVFVAFAASRAGQVQIWGGGRDEDDQPQVRADREQGGGGHVELSDGVAWDLSGTLVVDAMPQTIEVALRGRPLADLIRHPVLDGLDRIVRGTRRERFGDADRVHVDIAYQGIGLTADELLDIEPRRTM